MTDYIDRQAAIDAIEKLILPQTKGETMAEEINRVAWGCAINCAEKMIGHLPTAQPEWDIHTVACLLAELFDDTCACNYNGIDEWLPEKCELLDSCPSPGGVACWEQFLKHKAEEGEAHETD